MTVATRGLATLCLWMAGLGVCGTRAFAEDPAPEVEIDSQARLVSRANLNGNGAAVSQASIAIDASLPVAGSHQWGLGVDLIEERRRFLFDHFEQFIPCATPLKIANDLSVQPTLAVMPDERWTWLLQGNFEYAGAVGAKFSDAVLTSYSIAAIYKNTDSCRLGFGFQLRQRFPAHRYLMPFPLIDWHFGHWALTSLDGETGRLAYSIGRWTDIYAQIEFRSYDVRMAPDSPLAAGVLHYDAFPAVLGVRIKVNKHFILSVSSGLALAQQLRFEDQHGRFLQESNRPSPYCGGMEADWTF